MKTRSVLWVGLTGWLACATLTTAWAVPVGNNNVGREYLVAAQDLSVWRFGAYVEEREHDIEIYRGFAEPVKLSKTMGYVGLDILPWITVYGTAGSCDADLNAWGGSEPEYGAGINLNLLDYEILDPTLFEDRVRVNAGFRATRSETSIRFSEKAKWTEWFASATLSIVNDVKGEKFFSPNSIVLFGGPLYASLDSPDFDQDNTFGFTLGIEIFYTDSISFYGALETFEGSGAMAGIDIRF
jgi:hypothetical protein